MPISNINEICKPRYSDQQTNEEQLRLDLIGVSAKTFLADSHPSRQSLLLRDVYLTYLDCRC